MDTAPRLDLSKLNIIEETKFHEC